MAKDGHSRIATILSKHEEGSARGLDQGLEIERIGQGNANQGKRAFSASKGIRQPFARSSASGERFRPKPCRMAGSERVSRRVVCVRAWNWVLLPIRRRRSSFRSRSRCSRGCGRNSAAIPRPWPMRPGPPRSLLDQLGIAHRQGVSEVTRRADQSPAGGNAGAVDARGQVVGRDSGIANDRHAG